jgi:hypothetical protein
MQILCRTEEDFDTCCHTSGHICVSLPEPETISLARWLAGSLLSVVWFETSVGGEASEGRGDSGAEGGMGDPIPGACNRQQLGH